MITHLYKFETLLPPLRTKANNVTARLTVYRIENDTYTVIEVVYEQDFIHIQPRDVTNAIRRLMSMAEG